MMVIMIITEYNFGLTDVLMIRLELFFMGGHSISLNWGSKLVFPIIKVDYKCLSANADL